MAADRGIYVCQSQSMNLFIANPDLSKLNSAHFYGWRKKLKTGMYYLRTQPKTSPLKGLGIEQKTTTCSIENPKSCEECGA
jgi:ribonucleotide reductase alpha subunit